MESGHGVIVGGEENTVHISRRWRCNITKPCQIGEGDSCIAKFLIGNALLVFNCSVGGFKNAVFSMMINGFTKGIKNLFGKPHGNHTVIICLICSFRFKPFDESMDTACHVLCKLGIGILLDGSNAQQMCQVNQ